MISRFVANSEKCRKYTFLGGPPRLLRYYIGGLSKFITILHGGGLPDLLQYYRGGVSRDPKFELRNIWTAPKLGALTWRGEKQHSSKRPHPVLFVELSANRTEYWDSWTIQETTLINDHKDRSKHPSSIMCIYQTMQICKYTNQCKKEGFSLTQLCADQ